MRGRHLRILDYGRERGEGVLLLSIFGMSEELPFEKLQYRSWEYP
jgi:hypothetical protein